MSLYFKKHWPWITLCLLIVMNVFLIRLDLKQSLHLLTLAMLDVGQGDALFIESPMGTQLLFDAGPPRRILESLKRVISPFDRSIDVIVITNPDLDHFGGFAEILQNYKVGIALLPGTDNSSETFQNLRGELQSKKVPEVLARKGMKLHLGGGAVIDILFPDRDVSSWTTNDGSIVARLSYGSASVLLTGDATSETEKIILKNNDSIQSKILKVGHHGSRSSTSYAFTKAVSPEYALVSSGRGNSYGHPHEDVLETLSSFGAKIFRTDTLGTIVFESDGEKEEFKFYK